MLLFIVDGNPPPQFFKAYDAQKLEGVFEWMNEYGLTSQDVYSECPKTQELILTDVNRINESAFLRANHRQNYWS